MLYNSILVMRSHRLYSTEVSICTTDGSYDGKTPNVASSPRWLSGPLRVVALGGPTEDKFDACAHEWNCYLTVAESIRRQIESSPVIDRWRLVSYLKHIFFTYIWMRNGVKLRMKSSVNIEMLNESLNSKFDLANYQKSHFWHHYDPTSLTPC